MRKALIDIRWEIGTLLERERIQDREYGEERTK